MNLPVIDLFLHLKNLSEPVGVLFIFCNLTTLIIIRNQRSIHTFLIQQKQGLS